MSDQTGCMECPKCGEGHLFTTIIQGAKYWKCNDPRCDYRESVTRSKSDLTHDLSGGRLTTPSDCNCGECGRPMIWMPIVLVVSKYRKSSHNGVGKGRYVCFNPGCRGG
ncbi:MAG: hypothetical protein NT141_02460 [candidate division WWE3 bacterium]|nr:hypothetical protein [candidate division WWE3 bacterium]